MGSQSTFITLIFCAIMLFASSSLQASMWKDCQGGSCGSSNYCQESESPCACTDLGYRFNNCMSKEKYCRAFGNAGSLQ